MTVMRDFPFHVAVAQVSRLDQVKGGFLMHERRTEFQIEEDSLHSANKWFLVSHPSEQRMHWSLGKPYELLPVDFAVFKSNLLPNFFGAGVQTFTQLMRAPEAGDNANSLKAQLDQQKSVVDNLVSNTRLLESKIQEAKSKKDTLKARAQSARTATKVNEMVGNVNTSSALSAFEKMEEKGELILRWKLVCCESASYLFILPVLAMESEAEALGQLTTDDLDGKFALLESTSVDDDLANLKKELSGSSQKGELPPGKTVSASTNKPFPYRDAEIETELNELRQRANEL
ncbi:Membrane-associated 30 kDa protein [Hibiscus syriacus]|uniref:Membrane-associated 30 kDa protein n=1 Tax=Hibiscus syriacus TaxID=106335 RepID=A0A6A2ZK97_HIBSY|nr:Membrane-associated 30 kDa protein [Hibiscus syriacus]